MFTARKRGERQLSSASCFFYRFVLRRAFLDMLETASVSAIHCFQARLSAMNLITGLPIAALVKPSTRW